jgi:hypothetical protein
MRRSPSVWAGHEPGEQDPDLVRGSRADARAVELGQELELGVLACQESVRSLHEVGLSALDFGPGSGGAAQEGNEGDPEEGVLGVQRGAVDRGAGDVAGDARDVVGDVDRGSGPVAGGRVVYRAAGMGLDVRDGGHGDGMVVGLGEGEGAHQSSL